MSLEATVLCVDNSDFARNADYSPTRFEAQQDCVNLICGTKTQQNPENCVGILTMAGDRIQVQVAPTDDIGKILQGLHDVRLGGTCDVIRAVQTAQLALKHRANKNQRQRIILFAASPLDATEKQLETLGRMLKKNSVALDIVSIGEIDINSIKLNKLMQAVTSNENSHMVECPVGSGLLSDVLLSSPIIVGERAAAGGAGEGATSGAAEGGGGANDFGVDPNSDPELYMALRMSLEEERSRIERERQLQQQGEGDSSQAKDSTVPTPAPTVSVSTGTVQQSSTSAEQPTVAEIEAMEGIDEELREALLLSVRDYQGDTDRTKGGSPVEAPSTDAAQSQSAGGNLSDPSYVREVLGALPGVNLEDPRIEAVIKNADEKDKDKSMDTDEDPGGKKNNEKQ